MNAYLLNRKDIVIADTKEQAIKHYDQIPQLICHYNIPVLKLSLDKNFIQHTVLGNTEILSLREYASLIIDEYNQPPMLVARVTTIPFEDFVIEP